MLASEAAISWAVISVISPYSSSVSKINNGVRVGTTNASIIAKIVDAESISDSDVGAQVTYENLGWDFDNVWTMPAGGGYPILQWQVDGGVPSDGEPTGPVAQRFTANITTRLPDYFTKSTTTYSVAWDDAYFTDNAQMYNHELAKMCAILTSAAYGSSDSADDARVLAALTALKFQDVITDSYVGTGVDEAAFAIGHKSIVCEGVEYELVVVDIRGTKTSEEWEGNLTFEVSGLSNGDVHANFNVVKNDVKTQLASYIEQLDTTLGVESPYKILITGHSRGGAVANLLAKDLVDGNLFSGADIALNSLLPPQKDIFAYTFAAPNVVYVDPSSDSAVLYYNIIRNLYDNVHNIEHYDDFVPAILQIFKFDKYGKVYSFPRTSDFYNSMTANFLVFDPSTRFRPINRLMSSLLDENDSPSALNLLSSLKSNPIQEVFYNHNPEVYIAGLNVLPRDWPDLLSDMAAHIATGVRIECPVDVYIYDEYGILVGEVVNNTIDTTIDNPVAITLSGNDNDIKDILLPYERNFTIKLVGNDVGSMTYTVETVNTSNGATTETKQFNNVTLAPGKEMSSEVGGTIDTPDVKLLVVNSNGQVTATINEDGTETPVQQNQTGGSTPGNSTPTTPSTSAETTDMPDAFDNPFADIDESAWYYEAVLYAYKNGIMQGVGNNLFEPNISLTRAMLVQMLYNLENQPDAETASFDDVATSAWYANAIAWAANNGIVSGVGNNLFAPDVKITREQMAVMLYNYCTYKGIELAAIRDTGSFADANTVSDWAAEAVQAMYRAGILSGKGEGIFDPTGTATRAEVAQMLMNFMEAIK